MSGRELVQHNLLFPPKLRQLDLRDLQEFNNLRTVRGPPTSVGQRGPVRAAGQPKPDPRNSLFGKTNVEELHQLLWLQQELNHLTATTGRGREGGISDVDLK